MCSDIFRSGRPNRLVYILGVVRTILGSRDETSHISSIFGHKIRSLRSLNPELLKEPGRRSERIVGL